MTVDDAHVFQSDSVDPETRAFDAHYTGVVENPMIMSELAQDRTIHDPRGDIRLRTFVPDTVRGIYLYIHGGGWAQGANNLRDPMHEQTAREAGLAVVAVGYRLAPQHPYPAAVDDCEAAAVWLIEHAQQEFGANQIVVGGDSAGGHLAAVTLLRLRDRHGWNRALGAALTYGVYDLRSTPSARQARDVPGLNSDRIAWYADQFVPAERRCEPDVSPIFGDLRGLLPALFTVGTYDPLLDDTLFMHARWLAAGNSAELALYPGGRHGFIHHPLELGRRAKLRIREFLRSRVELAQG